MIVNLYSESEFTSSVTVAEEKASLKFIDVLVAGLSKTTLSLENVKLLKSVPSCHMPIIHDGGVNSTYTDIIEK